MSEEPKEEPYLDLVGVFSTGLGTEICTEVIMLINKYLKVGTVINKDNKTIEIYALEPTLRQLPDAEVAHKNG